jgi:two-component system, NtrC family, sensor histidine kinase HydH
MDSGRVKLKKISVIKPRYIIIFGLVISIIMIITSYVEYSENKREIYHLLDEHANSLIFAIDKSSANTIISEREMENLLSQHLLGVARNIARLDSIAGLSNELLVRIAEENEIYRINVFRKKGEKEFSNFVPGMHMSERGRYSPKDYIDSVLSGQKKEMVLGFKTARMESGIRYAVAVARPGKRGGAIVVNLDAESFIAFKKKIGFEKTISDIGKKSGIEYIVLQDENEILASDKENFELTRLNADRFLQSVLMKDSAESRIIDFKSSKVFEVVKSFSVDGEKRGVFRIGLSMDEIKMLENKMLWRGIIISFIIIVISVIVIAVVVSNQNYDMVSEEFKKIQTFTGEILANMNQGVITINKNEEVEIFNKKAEEIFGIEQKSAAGKKYSPVLKECGEIINICLSKEEVKNREMNLNLTGKAQKILSVNATIIRDSDDKFTAFNLVIDDITDIRNDEKQKRQNEKMIAMGELASGVAHEVRNPLNSINMIAQRFGKEYSGKLKSEEFDTLSDVLKNESARVNKIIEQFLRFARPPKLNKSTVTSKDFLNEVKQISEIIAKEKKINIEFSPESEAVLNIDIEQMKQVFINLIQNSADATATGGSITVGFKVNGSKHIFEISDTGEGIPEKNLSNIFNLYFTTKARGTGLGLSIVQQIVSQHNGNIYVESREKEGTKFIIELQNKNI